MKRIGKSTSRQSQVYLNEQYYVVAQNGVIIGSVRYAFFDGEQWCIAIRLHSGMPAHGRAPHDMGCVFDLIESEPPWTMPTVQPKPKPVVDFSNYTLIGWDMAKEPDNETGIPNPAAHRLRQGR